MTMVPTMFLSHFAQACGKAKERFENNIEFPFDESWFFQPTDVYNPYMAWAGMAICLSGYKNVPSNDYRYIRASFTNLGCEDIDITSYYHLNDENPIGFMYNVDQVSYAFGHRKVRNTDGTEQDLMVMMLRGTSDTVEWLSNSEVADSIANGDYSHVQYHEGFRNTALKAFHDLTSYTQAHNLDMGKAKLWVIGHSRGASIANAMAAIIDEDTTLGMTPDRMFAYTFSASRPTLRTDYNAKQFRNIFNIINPEDYIPRLPPHDWGIRRFGRDLYLPTISTRYADYTAYRKDFLRMFAKWTHMDFPAFHGNAYTNALEAELFNICPDIALMYQHKRFSHAGTLTFAQYFSLFTDLAAVQGHTLAVEAAKFSKYGAGTFEDFLGYFIHHQIFGHNAPAAHQEEGYLIKLALCCTHNIDIEQGDIPDVTRVTAYGPVNITVKNAAGNVVAQIEKGRVNEKLYDTDEFLSMYVNEKTDERSVWIPQNSAYTIALTAYDHGEIDMRESTLDAMGHTLTQTSYSAIPCAKHETVDWGQLKSTLQGHEAGACNNLNVDVEVHGVGKLKDDEAFVSSYKEGAHTMPIPGPTVICDARGFRNGTYGDHAIVHAHHAVNVKFLGWFEQGADPDTDKPLYDKETYVFPLQADRTLAAWFKKK